MTTPLPKRYGKTLPPIINPDGRVCFTIQVPDELEYRAAINGVIGSLGEWFTWEHYQTDYINPPTRNKEAAQVWIDALADATWEVCVSFCERMIECLLTDGDVQAALASLIATNPTIQEAMRDFILGDDAINQHITNIAAYQVLTAENRNENLLKPEACDPSFIFNQTSILVTLLNDLSTDILQAIEVETNGLERAELLVSGIPAIGGLFPVDELIGLADQIAEEVYEGYEGDWDEALYDDIRCGIFCLVKDDCTLSIDDVITFYEGRLSESLPSDPVEMFVALLQYILTGAFPPDMAVYAMHLLVLSAIRLSQNVLGVDFATMGLRVIAAGDEPDNDWEILCTSCPPEPAACDDMAASMNGYNAMLAGRAIWHDGEGWGRGTVNASYLWITREFTGVTITKVILKVNRLMETGTDYAIVLYPYNDVSQGSPIVLSTDNHLEYTFAGLSVTNGLTIYMSSGALLPVDYRLIEVCYEYAE